MSCWQKASAVFWGLVSLTNLLVCGYVLFLAVDYWWKKGRHTKVGFFRYVREELDKP